MNDTIQFEDFTKVDIRVGTIIEVKEFPKAKKPAYILSVDFGTLGVKTSSAQITTLYSKEELLNKQVLAVINFPKKQIANVNSECLVLGAVSVKDVVLLNPEKRVKNGTQVS